MKKLIRPTAAALVFMAAFLFAFPGSSAAPPKQINVLLVTGDDVEPAHNWREVSQAMKDTLLASGRFDVRVSEDAGILDSSTALGRYELVFLHLYNVKTPTLSPGAKENLVKFVKDGKGLVVSHLSSASFKEWNEFQQMCGRYWVMKKSGHGPRGKFKAHIANADHPITKGLKDFEADDELYAKLEGDALINVLVTADSDWSQRTEPLVFTVEFGKGRVFHQAFGHDGRAVRDNPTVQKLIQRGCEWTATGKVE